MLLAVIGRKMVLLQSLPPAVQPLTGDKNNPGNFYMYKCNKPDWTSAIFHSTNKGDSFTTKTQSAIPCAGEVNLKVNPTTANQLWLSTINADVNNRLLRYSSDSGTTFNTISGISGVRQFGFGKSAPGKTNPTLFVIGVVNGIEGLYKSDDATTLTPNPTFVNISQGRGFGIATSITGNMNKYAEVFVGTSGRGVMHYSEQITTSTLNIKTFLQAPFNKTTNQMKVTLSTLNLIPNLNPPTLPDAIDWITVDIQDINRASIVKQNLILKKDGSIVDITNNLPKLPTQITNSSYHILIKHRNHLPITTQNPITLDATTGVSYNFDTTSNLNIRNGNQSVMTPGIYAQKQGNANNDNAINSLDRTLVKASADKLNTYSNLDINMDGNISSVDRQIMKTTTDSF
jgi:hypothetical protein